MCVYDGRAVAVQVREVLRLTPRKRQTLLFSATMTEEVRALAALSLQRPVRLAADAAGHAPAQLQQEVVRLKVQHAWLLLLSRFASIWTQLICLQWLKVNGRVCT